MVRRDGIEVLDQKADEDLRGAEILLQTDEELLALVGFHLQQFLEKKMKVSLQEHFVKYPKTHDLSALLDLFPQSRITEADNEFAQILSQYAVESRYGLYTDPPWDGRQMLEKTKELADRIRSFWDDP
ncbi:MAG: HEPN domain-containing protein [Methanomassiliicoccaceae archaeon]|nr:HEPN domain-containing protein [Methanomassiliicoccaceae archaeon]